MKKILNILLTLLTTLLLFEPIYAEDPFDVTNWIFVMKTKGSIQNSNVVVSKFYDVNDESKYAFCLQPEERFLPLSATYHKAQYGDKRVFDIVKAYDDIGLNDDNYYIAAQILIWKQTNGIEYSFNEFDYSNYIKELEDQIIKNNNLKTNEENYIFDLDDIYSIEKDFRDYDIESNDIEIVSIKEDNFCFKLKDNKPKNITISLKPKDIESEHALVYYSETGQDIYHFDGKYNYLNPIKLNIEIKNNTFNINYSKKDESNIPIKGAQFMLYQIDDSTSDNIKFIKLNEEVNLLNVLINNENDDEYSIEVSERYKPYFKGNTICPLEVGYFEYNLYKLNELFEQGRIYVTNDSNICPNKFNIINAKAILSSYSDDKLVNNINDISKKNDYYLCEYEPAKGYTYYSEPCVLINGNKYNGDNFEFINNKRTYTLRLMKESDNNILLNGAEFNISYNLDNKNITKQFITGSLCISNDIGYKYLIIKEENSDTVSVYELNGDDYINKNISEGRYFYYLSDSNIVDNRKLINEYVDVVKGGFNLTNLPYSSVIKVEETKAPKGYIITEPIYYLYPDIKYSEITFTNYRINFMDIIPGETFNIPKTCVGE